MAMNINLALEVYSKRFLAGLTPQLAPLAAFSTDFSDELVEPGEKIRVPIVETEPAAAFNADSNNFSRPKADLKDAEVAIDKSAISGFGITLDQMANFRRNWWQARADQNVKAVAAKVQADVYALVSEDNYANTPVSAPLAGFTKKTAANIANKAAEAGLEVSQASLCLAPAWFYALLGELDSNVYGGAEAIRKGTIPELYGFGRIVKLPGYTAGPGFVCEPSAICVGGRKVQPADTTPYAEFGAMVEPETGMPINRVVYTSGAAGATSFSALAWYGAGVGVADALVRLTA